MKRMISVFSALVILFSSIYAGFISTNIFAQSNELLISDCETLTGWTKTGGNALAINSNGFSGSAVSCNIDRGAFRTATYTAATPLDISNYQNIQWDVMMHNGGKAGMWDDIKEYYGDEVYLKIGSSATDYNVYRLSKMTVEQDSSNPLWYHFSIDIENPTSTTGSFDKTKMTIFYFTTIDGAINTSVSNGHIRIDNIYARNLIEQAPEQVEDLVLSECETLENWTYANANMGMTVNGMTGSAININTSYGAFRKLTFTKKTDLSNYNTIEFNLFCMKVGDISYDMWSDITASYGDKIAVEISDGTNVNTYGLNKWDITALGNNWYHVSVNLNDATSAAKNFDLAGFESFSVYANTTASLDTNLPNTTFRVDNLIARYDEANTSSPLPEPTPDPDGVWSIPGAFERTTQGTFSFVLNNFDLDLSLYKKSELYLTMRVFIENTDGSENVLDFTSEGQIELTSSGDCDKQEANWSVPKLGLKSGWNDIRLSIANADTDTGLNLSNVNYFRFYSRKAGDAEFNVKIEDVKITNIKEESIVSSYFSNGMMFSQNKPMNVFGNVTEAGLNVTAKLKDKNGVIDEKSTVSESDGAWDISFTGRAGGYDAYSIEIYVDGALKKTINDILIGELWLAAGQSNMEFFVLQTIPDYDYNLIPLNEYVRFFDEPLVPGGVNAVLPSAPATDIEGAKWADGSNAVDVKYISAIAYYMSLQLQTELNVPIGFINAAKGASVIESWLPREVIENDSIIKSTLEERGIYKTAEQLSGTEANWTYLTTLYNSKIAPLAGVNINGMLWYQGESNIKYANEDGYNTFYKNSLLGLIDSYSKLFGYEQGDMPFICAHLAPYNYSNIRSDYDTVLASFSEMLSDVTEETAAQMIQIPIYDLALDYRDPPINNPDPIHPNSKYEVGTRFAQAVLAGVYGVGDSTAANAPVADSWKIEGNKIVITFKNVGSGLGIIGSEPELHGFAVCGSDRVFVRADAKIVSPNSVEVYSDKVTAPVAATYGWSSFNMASNLCNSLGIPAVPYRTDNTVSVYYQSMDWGYCDFENIWDAKITLEAGYKPTYTTSSNASITLVDDKTEGSAAVKLNYAISESTVASISPVLNYSGMVNQYMNYSGITLSVKNTDNRAKKMSIEIVAGGESYLASVVTGNALATEYEVAKGEYKEYTFNFKRIVDSDGRVLRDSATVLKTMTALNIRFEDTADGAILLDDIYLRADTLPTPGAENDQLVDGVVDTTPGSLDNDGNMWVSDADTENGWSVTGSTLGIDAQDKTQGKGSIGATSTNGVLRQIAFTSATPLDISDYDYFEFDVYFSNMKWFNANTDVMFELTSSGGPDNESDRYMKGYLSNNQPEFYDAAVSGTDVGAWYHVKLILGAAQTQARGGMDDTRFNFFRFFAVGAPTGTVDFEVKFDNLKFTKEPSGEIIGAGDESYGVVIDNTSMWMSDADSTAFWSATGSEVVVDTDKKTQGSGSAAATGKNGVLRQIAFTPKTSLDISDYDYLEFDVYFSNMEWFNVSESVMFELTSSGGPDNESSRYMKGYLRDNQPEFYEIAESGTDKAGWYHIKLILNSPQTEARGGLDETKFNFFRFFAIGAPAGTPDFDVKFDNVKFTKDPSGEASGATDPAYGKAIDDTSMWMTDGDSLVFWSATGTEVTLNSDNKTQGESAIAVTAKGGVLKQIAFVPKSAVDISDYQYLEFDIYFSNLDWYNACNGTMFELTSAGTCDIESNRYTKSSMLEASPAFAADIESGNGGGKWYHFKLNLDRPHTSVKGGMDKTAFDYFRFYTVELADGTADYTMLLDNIRFTKGEKAAEIVKTDEYIIINNGDSAAGWSSPGQEVMFDGKNKTEGKGSVSVTAKGGILKELAYRPTEPIDLTGYKYLKFDLFLSDITCLNTATGFMVELTSSGTCDDASNRYMKSAILAACPELAADLANGAVGNKWYSFCFNLEKPQNQVKGGLDMTAFNFFRIYFLGSPEGTPDCVVNIDNLRVTVDGVDKGTSTPSTNQTINFGSGSTTIYKNVGNKENGGLLAEPLTPMPEELIKKAYAIGYVILSAVIAIALVLMIYAVLRKKKKGN